jgi:hypothetical protein
VAIDFGAAGARADENIYVKFAACDARRSTLGREGAILWVPSIELSALVELTPKFRNSLRLGMLLGAAANPFVRVAAPPHLFKSALRKRSVSHHAGNYS